MVSIPMPNGGQYRIEATEVTNGRYAAFLSAGAAPTQGSSCAWNTSFAVDDPALECNKLWDPQGRPTFPVVCVDWCDAAAYCKWVGKRLCGDFGGAGHVWTGTPLPGEEWGTACSADGTKMYPYGNTYDPSACVGTNFATSAALAPVKEASGCEGGYPGLFDMSGNAAELVDSCSSDTGADDTCTVAGGAYNDTSAALACGGSVHHTAKRSDRSVGTGFRCCAD